MNLTDSIAPESHPTVRGITARLRCGCGEDHEFDGVEDGWQHVYPCDCGRRVSVQLDYIAQYDQGI